MCGLKKGGVRVKGQSAPPCPLLPLFAKAGEGYNAALPGHVGRDSKPGNL